MTGAVSIVVSYAIVHVRAVSTRETVISMTPLYSI